MKSCHKKSKSNWLDIMANVSVDLEVPQLPQPVNRREDDEELEALHPLHPISPVLHPLQDIDHQPEEIEEAYSSNELDLARLLAGGFQQEE